MAKKTQSEELQETLSTFEFHGVDTTTRKNGHVITDCPFCTKEDHFYIRTNNSSNNGGIGSCDCKVCGPVGNKYSFLHQYYNQSLKRTSDSQYTKLASYRRNRGGHKCEIPPSAYKAMGLAYDKTTKRWLVPIHNTSGSIVNLKTYDTNHDSPYLCSTAGCKQHLYNAHELHEPALARREIIVVVEGEWDAIALRYLLSKLPKSIDLSADDVAIVGTSAASLPTYELGSFSGEEVWLIYDNDDAGRKGLNKAIEQLNALPEKPKSIHALRWPESTPDKYDLFSLISDSPRKHHHQWTDIQDMMELVTKPITKPKPKTLERTKFSQILTDFRKTGVSMSKSMENGLALTAATVLSSREVGDPIWLYMVGPSGCGKSLVLESAMTSEQCVYRGSIGAKDFLSGFKHDEGLDPSLLSQITDPQRCLLIKDYTGILALPPYEITQLYGVFREAYDGAYVRGYGNGVKRSYTGYFSILAGVTPKIHTLNDTDVGERFLKYQLAGRSNVNQTKALMAAITGGSNNADTYEHKQHRQAAMAAFTDHLLALPKLPALSASLARRIANLAQFTAMSRAKVDRDRDGAVRYQADPEAANRLAKQLVKLAQCTSAVFGLKRSNERVSDLTTRVAWDTAYGRKREALWLLFNSPDGVDRKTLMDKTRLPSTTAYRVLEDLFELGLVEHRKKRRDSKGRPSYTYALKPNTRQIITDCKFK